MNAQLRKHQQLQALRSRVRVLRDTMNSARLEYLRTLLELKALQGNAAATDRITRQIRSLLDRARPRDRANCLEDEEEEATA